MPADKFVFLYTPCYFHPSPTLYGDILAGLTASRYWEVIGADDGEIEAHTVQASREAAVDSMVFATGIHPRFSCRCCGPWMHFHHAETGAPGGWAVAEGQTESPE